MDILLDALQIWLYIFIEKHFWQYNTNLQPDTVNYLHF